MGTKIIAKRQQYQWFHIVQDLTMDPKANKDKLDKLGVEVFSMTDAELAAWNSFIRKMADRKSKKKHVKRVGLLPMLSFLRNTFQSIQDGVRYTMR
jgi:hypothetical protein